MRLATFNVENLFDRPKAMSLATWAEGKPVLERFAQLLALLGEPVYTPAIAERMVALMVALGLEKSDTGPFVQLRRNRGALLNRPRKGGLTITASGRADWVGTLALIDAPVDEESMRNTARVVLALEADVLAMVEVESRPVLQAFNQQMLKALGGKPFEHVMLIDGNDPRGIDVGLMTRAAYPIGEMRSHVDDRAPDGSAIFSRDCAEFSIGLGNGRRLWLLVNHLKSKGYGSAASSNARRRLQAQRVQAIYAELQARGETLVAVVGDFNDTPDSAALAPLLSGTDLKDASAHPAFDDGGYPGTFDQCKAGQKIDYLLLSPAVFATVQAGGVMRKGLWPGVRPKRWAVFPELTKPEQAASDHAAVWVDLAL
jgi:endonuclease/exonuclease/phosphatase family metal-dependent hydrolase